MKRVGNLFDKIVSLENLKLADENARRGKLKSYGVRKHDMNREANILMLQKQLIDGTFKTSKYHVFTIFEPKEREIFQLPYFPDRIVHHAVMNILEPIWVSVFTNDTYSCIKNRGILKCAIDTRRMMMSDPVGTKYCLKLDIRKYYPSIDHTILKNILRRKIKDERLLNLLDGIVDSVEHGVPIGNYLSQYFANLYLTYFDHWVKEVLHIRYYKRYADDIVIFAGDKETLHRWLAEIRAYLKNELKLTIKHNWQIFPVESRGVDFVGYVIRHSHTRLRKRIKQALCRRVAQMLKQKVIPTPMQFKQAIASWWGWLKYCNSKNFVKQLKLKIPYEIEFAYAKRTLRHGARHSIGYRKG